MNVMYVCLYVFVCMICMRLLFVSMMLRMNITDALRVCMLRMYARYVCYVRILCLSVIYVCMTCMYVCYVCLHVCMLCVRSVM